MQDAVDPSRERLRRLSADVVLPFELRCHFGCLHHSSGWPGGRPVTVNRKICRKMLRDRNPLMRTFADKRAARDYVANYPYDGTDIRNPSSLDAWLG